MLQEDMRRRLYVSAMQRGAAVYAVLLLPLGYVMPPYLAWENGVLEMLQNIVLFGDMCLAAYFFRKTAGMGGKSIHRLWLAAAGYFLLLLGRELSWGRVFFPTGMDSHGPTFVSMNSIPGHEMIHAAIGVSYFALSSLVCLGRKFFMIFPFPPFYSASWRQRPCWRPAAIRACCFIRIWTPTWKNYLNYWDTSSMGILPGIITSGSGA